MSSKRFVQSVGVVGAVAVALALPAAAADGLRGKIVFSSDRDSHSGASWIWVMRADGSLARRLTHSARGDADPVWSPSGREIAFNQNDGGHPFHWSVWVMRADGTHHRRVIGDGVQPAWSPSGRWIAFGRGTGVWVVHRDGSGAHRVANGNFGGATASWSPNSQWLAVTTSTFEQTIGPDGQPANDIRGHLELVHPDGSGARTLLDTPERGSPEQSAWSPDGRRIVFTREFFAGDAGELWSIPSTGGKPTRLAHNASRPDFSPDGRNLIFDGLTNGTRGGVEKLYVTDAHGHRRRQLLEHSSAWFHADLVSADWSR